MPWISGSSQKIARIFDPNLKLNQIYIISWLTWYSVLYLSLGHVLGFHLWPNKIELVSSLASKVLNIKVKFRQICSLAHNVLLLKLKLKLFFFKTKLNWLIIFSKQDSARLGSIRFELGIELGSAWLWLELCSNKCEIIGEMEIKNKLK